MCFYDEQYVIKDLLLGTDIPKTEIARTLEISLGELNRRIRVYNLDWIRPKAKKMSRGQTAVVEILKKIIPNTKIEFEHHVGERLLVDVYVPSYNLGIEYHGRQHFEWVPFFHKSEADFELAVERDHRKAELCKQQGMTLVVFRYDDVLTEADVFTRILTGIRNSSPTDVATPPVKRYSRDIEKIKQERKELRKSLRRKSGTDEDVKQRQRDIRRKVRENRKQRAKETSDTLFY